MASQSLSRATCDEDTELAVDFGDCLNGSGNSNFPFDLPECFTVNSASSGLVESGTNISENSDIDMTEAEGSSSRVTSYSSAKTVAATASVVNNDNAEFADFSANHTMHNFDSSSSSSSSSTPARQTDHVVASAASSSSRKRQRDKEGSASGQASGSDNTQPEQKRAKSSKYKGVVSCYSFFTFQPLWVAQRCRNET
jgi:hypothetical protein